MTLTKIATTDAPEFYLFETTTEELAYWEEICTYCEQRDCNEDCILIPANAVKCDDCNGQGRIKFTVNRPDAYFVITKCGMCEGIGLV